MLCNPQQHISRRRLLSGASTIGGMSMMSSIAGRLAASEQRIEVDPSRPSSLILLWLSGGPSQLETFDPHPGTKIGGDVQSIQTSTSGIEIADTLPRTAEIMHHAALVRSVTGQEGEHARATYNMRTGFRLDPTLRHPTIGAVVCHVDPTESDIPRHVSIMPGRDPGRGGYLGANYDAFQMGDPAAPVPDVKSSVSPERQRQRIESLFDVLESEFARGRIRQLTDRTLHRSVTEAASRMMSSDQLAAFDVSTEPEAVRQAFGDNPFGRGTLAASRLIETGVRCVEVTLDGWDSHAANHTLQSGTCETLDPALAALVTRLSDRDQLDRTLVVCAGEFGRTPQINPAEGRDHWPHGFSVFMAGHGIGKGRVIGGTSPNPTLDSAKPMADVDQPVTIEDLHATILRTFGIDHEIEIDTPARRPIKRSEGTVIEELLANVS